jgi:hypothetical protein
MEESAEPVVIPLRLSPARYGFGASILGLLGAAMAYLSVQPTLAKPSMTPKGQAIGRLLMSLDPIAGVWPLAAAWALVFLGGCAFIVWAVVARRPFELTLDARGITWPSLPPWRGPRSMAWSQIGSVGLNGARDHLVLQTSEGRRVIPVWWLPREMPPAEVIRTAQSLMNR